MYQYIFILSIFFIIYGNNIKNRKECVICGNKTPCIINSCKPVGVEGHLLYYFVPINMLH
jgi:hypothetical protein